MKFFLSFLFILLLFLLACNPPAETPQLVTPFERDSTQTTTYEEMQEYYQLVEQAYPNKFNWQAIEDGTDAGKPLYYGVLSADGDFDPVTNREKGKLVYFINNGIHPGEPCGVDATMMFVRDLLQQEDMAPLLDQITIVFIPLYNVGGALNRGSFSRANQNGPASYGFRGNAQNLDLNRDFIKCDSRNARSFASIFTAWRPDLFVDTHTSNGADYQYTMTLIPTHPDKIGEPIRGFMKEDLLPPLFERMAEKNWEMCPYVYAREVPDMGIAGFLDLPRYASGYTALFNTIGFITETHMLKPFPDRVRSTYAFLLSLLELAKEKRAEIKAVRLAANNITLEKQSFALNWQLNVDEVDSIRFKGYTWGYRASKVSGLDRLYYDQEKPFDKKIPYFNQYDISLKVDKPLGYVFPKAYQNIADLLRLNGVRVTEFDDAKSLPVEMYIIGEFDDRKAYEGHYLHRNVQVKKESTTWTYRGGYVVYLDQASNNFIISVLEPHAPDSYFAWNYFDGILMQKEYFSPYVFEEVAAEMLEKNPALRDSLARYRAADAEFAKSGYRQLEYLYRQSPHYEQTHRRYPVGRLLERVRL